MGKLNFKIEELIEYVLIAGGLLFLIGAILDWK